MSNNKQKLELTWIGKNNLEYNIANIEPRILEERKDLSYGDPSTENMVIYGDNLLALRALLPDYEGKVKCIYIDPPYNIDATGVPYEDCVEHSLWLSLMRPRLEFLWQLLTQENGTLLVSINDHECHYFKVLCDELFGRKSFVASLVWNYEGNTDNQANIINYHEYILVYSKTGKVDPTNVIDPSIGETSKLFKEEIRNTIVKNGPKNPPKTVFIPAGFPAAFEEGIIRKDSVEWPKYNEDIIVKKFKLKNSVEATTGWSSRSIFENFISNDFQPVPDSKGQETVLEITRTGAIEAVKKRKQQKGHFVSVLRGHGTTNQMRLMLKKMGIKFAYPKPIDLIAYLVNAFSGPNDLILDSFVGSGTTAHAVLQLNKKSETNRKFIVIELSKDTVDNVLLPRLHGVISGSDKANIEPNGGGFKFYELAPSFVTIDEFGNPVIDSYYNDTKLIRAMCKLMNYTFAPDSKNYWKHGNSQGNNSIYVTTQMLSVAMVQQISNHLNSNETLLICPKKFEPGCENVDTRITIKKIPQSILKACHYGKKEYLLPIKEQSIEEIDEELDEDQK